MAGLSEMFSGQCPCTQHSVSGTLPLALVVTSQTAQDTYPFLKSQLRFCSRDSFPSLSLSLAGATSRVLASCVLAMPLPYPSLLERSNCPATELKDWVSLVRFWNRVVIWYICHSTCALCVPRSCQGNENLLRQPLFGSSK